MKEGVLFRLTRNEIIILKQFSQGIKYASDIKLKTSKAMKYRIMNNLVKNGWLTFDMFKNTSIKAKIVRVSDKEILSKCEKELLKFK
jgi:hypothetical protein